MPDAHNSPPMLVLSALQRKLRLRKCLRTQSWLEPWLQTQVWPATHSGLCIYWYIHSTSTHWGFLGAGLGGRRFTNFSNFNPHNCRASINSDYTDQVVKWLSQSSDALKNDPHNGTSALAAAKGSSGQKGSWLLCVHVCMQRDDSVLSDRTFPLL